jgi:3-deoxy-D-manno-octulosonic-acid transferase
MAQLRLRAYSFIWWLALPLVLVRLWLRGHQEPGYRAHISERLSFHLPAIAGPVIWLHAVSVGETRAAEPLIRALLQSYPAHTILLTHMTPTGRATGRMLFGHQSRVVQAYLPYDTIWMTRRFVAHYQPSICVLMETEVWPSLIAACARANVAVALVNARLSERSFRRALRFEGLLGAAARQITLVAAQTYADAERLQLLGAKQVEVTGSLKFDVEPPAQMLKAGLILRKQIGARAVLLCASTRGGEEQLILAALVENKAILPADLLLVIVPRHPQRFDDVAQTVKECGLSLARRSQLGSDALPHDTQVLLGDSMGEMFTYYAACDVAFIGGSLLQLGGQNFIEACACGKPVLIGSGTFNFAQSSDAAIAAGAAVRVADAAQMLGEAARIIRSEAICAEMSQQALNFSAKNRGATQKIMLALKKII